MVFNSIFDDLMLALRIYRRTALTSGAVMMVLSIALAFAVALVALFSDLALKPNPGFERSSALLTIGAYDGQQMHPLDLATIVEIRKGLSSLDAVAGVRSFDQFMVVNEQRQTVATELVTQDYFGKLQPRMLKGRSLVAADHANASELVAIISYNFWQTHFAGRDDALGSYIKVYGPQLSYSGADGIRSLAEQALRYRVVGIMAPAMRGTFGRSTSLWIALEPTRTGLVGEHQHAMESLNVLHAVGRLAAGKSINQASSELKALHWGEELAEHMEARRWQIIPNLVLDFRVWQDALNQVRLLLITSLMILLLAAMNTGIFVLSMAPDRRKELAIRRIVGAQLSRLVRQLITEIVAFVATSAMFGLVLGFWFITLVRGLTLFHDAPWQGLAILDWRAVIALLIFTIVTSALIAMIALPGNKRSNLAISSTHTAPKAGFSRRLLAAVQLTVTGVLAFVALAAGWHLYQLHSLETGVAVSGRVAVVLAPDIDMKKAFAMSQEEISLLRDRRRQAIESIIGSERVAFGTPLPFTGNSGAASMRVAIASRINNDYQLAVNLVSADAALFQMLQMKLISGRFPAEHEYGVIVVNTAFAEAYLGSADIIGETINVRGILNEFQVIGLVQNAHFGHPADSPVARLYSTILPTSLSESILVHTELTASALRRYLEKKLFEGKLDLNINTVQSLDQLRDKYIAADHARFQFTASTAVLIIVLSALSLFGIQHYHVLTKRREYAIRSAVGASANALMLSIIGYGFTLALPGLVAGTLIGGFAVIKLQNYGIFLHRLPLLEIGLTVAVGLVLLVLLASVGPAWLAAHRASAQLLREE